MTFIYASKNKYIRIKHLCHFLDKIILTGRQETMICQFYQVSNTL